MNTAYPLTIYYDASCRLCNSEMQNIKIHDQHNQLILIDCSSAEFDDKPFQAEGITKTLMMNRLHARDADGNWLVGVDAFEVIYRTIGLNFLARLWGSSLTKPVAEWLYPWVVKQRYLLSKMGLPQLFTFWGKHAARKAEKRSRICADGKCNISE